MTKPNLHEFPPNITESKPQYTLPEYLSKIVELGARLEKKEGEFFYCGHVTSYGHKCRYSGTKLFILPVRERAVNENGSIVLDEQDIRFIRQTYDLYATAVRKNRADDAPFLDSELVEKIKTGDVEVFPFTVSSDTRLIINSSGIEDLIVSGMTEIEFHCDIWT